MISRFANWTVRLPLNQIDAPGCVDMSIWFTEELHPYYRKGVRIKRVLADEQTQYQHLQFVETEFFGNA